MPLFDYSLEKLRDYKPAREEQPDFDAFWADTLSDVRKHSLDATFTPYDADLSTVDTYDVTFAGWNGDPVKGWLIVPKQRTGPLPCVVEYIGYNGGRGAVTDHLLYSAAGFANFVMDTRGQGGDTGDNHGYPDGPTVSGRMTNGILDPSTYYYRRLMSDAVRAVEAARSHPDVDAEQITVAGGSQGGGLTLAAAGLSEGLVGALPDVPFLCHYRRATDITDRDPYGEIARFCAQQPRYVDQVFKTLSYFDGVNLAARATAPTLFSVGLMDMVCPPSTVYAAYNHYNSTDKDIRIWTYNGHEGGHRFQVQDRLRWLHKRLG